MGGPLVAMVVVVVVVETSISHVQKKGPTMQTYAGFDTHVSWWCNLQVPIPIPIHTHTHEHRYVFHRGMGTGKGWVTHGLPVMCTKDNTDVIWDDADNAANTQGGRNGRTTPE
jgi:hypothetical protein